MAAGVASVARRLLAGPRPRAAESRVLEVDEAGRRVTFSSTTEALVPGRYSFWFGPGAGHARIGEIVDRSSSGVTREGTVHVVAPAAEAQSGNVAVRLRVANPDRLLKLGTLARASVVVARAFGRTVKTRLPPSGSATMSRRVPSGSKAVSGRPSSSP